ncbi:MAG: hypothetical protein ABEH77_03625 [Halobacteriaceae archaeon]
MTDLRSCYFCGTAEAVEEGPAVPPALDPPDAVQQSVVLCPACREKLTAVLEPVFADGVDAAGAAAGTGDGGAGAGDDDSTDDGSLFGVFDADTPESPVGSDSGSGSPTPDAAASGDDDTAPAVDDGAAGDGPPVDRIPDSGGGDPDGAGGVESPGGPRGTDGADAPAETPEEYYTVLRFLENREFPVARSELVGVVAGAYDLSEREVGEILDAAVDRGVLVEVGGTLARSREQL